MDKVEFNLDQKFKRNEKDFITSNVDGETVLMNLETGKYYGLNSVSTTIWNQLSDALSFNDVVDLLVKEYEIEKEQCKEDSIEAFMIMDKFKFIIPETT